MSTEFPLKRHGSLLVAQLNQNLNQTPRLLFFLYIFYDTEACLYTPPEEPTFRE